VWTVGLLIAAVLPVLLLSGYRFQNWPVRATTRSQHWAHGVILSGSPVLKHARRCCPCACLQGRLQANLSGVDVSDTAQAQPEMVHPQAPSLVSILFRERAGTSLPYICIAYAQLHVSLMFFFYISTAPSAVTAALLQAACQGRFLMCLQCSLGALMETESCILQPVASEMPLVGVRKGGALQLTYLIKASFLPLHFIVHVLCYIRKCMSACPIYLLLATLTLPSLPPLHGHTSSSPVGATDRH